jgi:carotenoid cleavage dioxygenase
VDASGDLVQSEVVEVGGPTMIHDFAITERHVIFMDLPVVFDIQRARQGTMPYTWSDDYPARLGVMPRGGHGRDVRWFEIDPCYVFHAMNACADGERVVLDVARYPTLWRAHAQDFETARLHRFTLDIASGTVREQALDERAIEFPRVDPRREGRRNRYGYAVSTVLGDDAPGFGSLVQYDLERGTQRVHDFGRGRVPGEGVFVPAGAGEDEGFVLTLVYDEARNASELVILDATSFEKPPAACVLLPRRVPFGFHGNWVADS